MPMFFAPSSGRKPSTSARSTAVAPEPLFSAILNMMSRSRMSYWVACSRYLRGIPDHLVERPAALRDTVDAQDPLPVHLFDDSLQVVEADDRLPRRVPHRPVQAGEGEAVFEHVGVRVEELLDRRTLQNVLRVMAPGSASRRLAAVRLRVEPMQHH